MCEENYISELTSRWPRVHADEVSLTTLALADKAVADCPNSAKLWCMRGNLIQLGPESSPHSLEDALKSYQRAIEVDPSYSEAWDEIGHYYDAILNDEGGAQKYFREAERLKTTHEG